ncbi:hypothetical protein fugu_003891 [Takifugu bimaculatus]|uniref:General transcription factor IIH subunit 3 n=1 Tax=Takifugu bimaculatus TaxID=433685 RepID=A0A4Z2BCV6_9TELE|nr:hypothetical protein fugu_003891 [Takifugu bimaculatus]
MTHQEVRAIDDEISLLVIVVDVNPIWWGQQAQRESEFTLSKCLDSVMVLGNSHMAMARTNKLAVIASHCQDSHFLYPSNKLQGGENGEENTSCSGDGKYELLSIANNSIAEEMRNLMLKTEVRGNSNDTLLAGSLAKALCCILKPESVIKAAEDCALQYMNFMNVIFAAQKQNILIDACVLDMDSGLLQQVFGFPLVSPSRIIEDTTLGNQPSVLQACDITGGLYLKIPQKAALAQYLLWVFLPDTEQRSQLLLPPRAHVDYRAACFCHRNLIEIGYVCSVCLSIFCNFSPICTTCETAFKIQLPQMVKPKKKKVKL